MYYNIEIKDNKKYDMKITFDKEYDIINENKKINEYNEMKKSIVKSINKEYMEFHRLTSVQTFIVSSLLQNIDSVKYKKYEETLSITKKLPIVSNSSILFPQLKSCKKEKIKVLNIVNLFQYIDVNALNQYRQNNISIHTTKKDVFHIVDLYEMKDAKQQSIDKKYMSYFNNKPFLHERMKGSVCNNIGKFIHEKEDERYDLVLLNLSSISDTIENEYRNFLQKIGLLSNLSKIVKNNGDMIMTFSQTELKVSIDLLHLMKMMFEKVNVVKSFSMDVNDSSKLIVCQGYKKDIKIEEELSKVFEYCVKTTLEGKKVSRILSGISDKSLLQELVKNEVESMMKDYELTTKRMKDEDNLLLYQNESKVAAKQYYDDIKVPVPITYLYDEKYLIKQFNQSPGLNIIIGKKDSGKQIKYNELEEKRNGIEIDLYMMKRQIDNVDNMDRYFKVTDLFKVSNQVIKPIAQKITKYKVSQAFLKMCEMLHNTEIVNKKSIDVFHLCEAPGQFILAFDRYCSKRKINYDWTATTLRDGVGDDYGLIKRFKEKWIFGADNTGDITHIKNILSFTKKKYDIVTSDCGMPTIDFGFQEEELLKINHCQLTTMLMCLKNGGNCVFKTFLPIMYPLSISLFNILYLTFEKVVYFKPTLNPSSSEIYVLGINFKGLPTKIEEQLLNTVTHFDENVWLFDSFSEDFVKKHFDSIQECINNTKRSITRSILMYYYYKQEKHLKMLKDIQTREAHSWIKKFL
jgi:hypothetical protein